MALAASVLSLGLGEIVVRVLGVAPGYAAIPFEQYLVSGDPELLWEPRPGAQSVNSLGLRGAEPSAENPRPCWLALGDSVAWGLELADEETIPARLAVHLAAAGRDVEVHNAGVSGYNTLQEARRLELFAPRLAPEHVLLLFCVNDVDPADGLPEGVLRLAHRNDASEALRRAHAAGRGSTLERALLGRSHLARLVHETLGGTPRTKQSNAEQARHALEDIARGLDRIAAVAAAHGFEVTLVIVPLLADLGPQYPLAELHASVTALARERGFDTLDLLPVAVEEVRRRPRHLGLPGDSLHPNAECADLFAAAIAAHCLRGDAESGDG